MYAAVLERSAGGPALKAPRFWLPLLILLAPIFPAQAAYTAELLTVLPEGADRVVQDLNDSGESVGGSLRGGHQRGFLLRRGGVQTIRGLPGTDYSIARGINNIGEIVGSTNAGNTVRAFRRTPTGILLDLGTLPGDVASEAFAVNQLGQATGYSSGGVGLRAVTWNRTGAIQLLPKLPGSDSSKGFAINDLGDIAGISVEASRARAVLWKNGQVRDLGTLPRDRVSEALAINNRGEIAGSSGDPTEIRHPVLWRSDGAILDLGALPGGNAGRAFSINDLGTVVGTSGERAFVWTAQGGMQDLNHLVKTRSGIVLTDAIAVNSQGVILAVGLGEEATHQHGGGHVEIEDVPIHVFLLVPTR